MVETRRSSSSSKRPLSSPSPSMPNRKRSKVRVLYPSEFEFSILNWVISVVFQFRVCGFMQGAEASSSSMNDSPSSEEVVGAAASKELEAGSADLDSGGAEKQSEDVAADKSPEAVAAGEVLAFGSRVTVGVILCAACVILD